jgi:hypothetical protein
MDWVDLAASARRAWKRNTPSAWSSSEAIRMMLTVTATVAYTQRRRPEVVRAADKARQKRRDRMSGMEILGIRYWILDSEDALRAAATSPKSKSTTR